MKVVPIKIPRTLQKTFPFTGGLNEQVSNLELSPGELTTCLNYEEIDGSFHGYKSWGGFERWDGSVRSVEFPSGSGSYVLATYPSDVGLDRETDGSLTYTASIPLFTEDGVDQFITEDDTNLLVTEDYYGDVEREGRRASIPPCPGVGSLLYCGFYKNRTYAIRGGADVNGVATGFAKLWMMEIGSLDGEGGYVEVTEFPSDIPVNDIYSSPYRDAICRFATYPPLSPNTRTLALCNGVSEGILIHRDDTDTHTVEYISDSSLPVGVYPTIPVFFENRIYLAYPKGHLFFSNLGIPTFDNVLGFAGEYFFGSEITDMVSSPGDAIVVWMEEGIKVLNRIEPSSGNEYANVIVETFSTESGSIPMTGGRFLGTMIYCDDRGVTTLETSSAFGDFKAASISKRVQSTYQSHKSSILGAVIDRESNQYIILFRGGDGLAITFDIEKKVKGSTYFDTNHVPTCFNYGKDPLGDNVFIFGDSEGYVQFYRDEAMSFDGEAINTRIDTAFFHYGSVIHQKSFSKILLELSGQKGVTLFVGTSFDYKGPDIPKAITQETLAKGAGSIWGLATWGAFEWGSGAVVDQANIYILGMGVNMSISITTSSAHSLPHTIHNATVNYSGRNIKY